MSICYDGDMVNNNNIESTSATGCLSAYGIVAKAEGFALSDVRVWIEKLNCSNCSFSVIHWFASIDKLSLRQ